MKTYSKRIKNKLLKSITEISNKNERIIVISQIWWKHFSGENQETFPELKKLLDEHGIFTKGVSSKRLSEIVKTLPVPFRKTLKPFKVEKTFTSKAKHQAEKEDGVCTSNVHEYAFPDALRLQVIKKI